MSVGWLFVMLTENSGIRCVSLKFIKTSLAEQEENVLNICTDLLLHAEAEENFMEVIITVMRRVSTCMISKRSNNLCRGSENRNWRTVLSCSWIP
jgi:hypothetical protein